MKTLEIEKLKTEFTQYTNYGNRCEKYYHNEEDYFYIRIDENNNEVYQLNGEHECYGLELNSLEDIKVRFKSFTGVELDVETINDKTTIQISKETLQTLLKNFYEVCALCDELDIYEHNSMDDSMQEMKEWAEDKFGRDINKDKYD